MLYIYIYLYNSFIFVGVDLTTVLNAIIYWHVLCSLEPDCISPPGARLKNPKGPRDPEVWFQMHRYDQSCLGVLLFNFRSVDSLQNVSATSSSSSLRPERGGFLKIQRQDPDEHHVRSC